MRYILTLSFFILFLSAPVQAQEKVNYWLIEAPVAEGATNIERKRDDEQFWSRLTYEISVKNPDTIYETYKKFYEDKGWANTHPNNFGKDKSWDGPILNVFADGTPAATYRKNWSSPNKAFSANVVLNLTDYDDTVFKGKLEIIIGPNPPVIFSHNFMMSQLNMYSELRDIFITSRVFGKDINDLSKFDFNKVPEKYKNEKVVVAIKKRTDSAKQQYKEFGDKYVDRTAIPGK